jgi:hypothetical protein
MSNTTRLDDPSGDCTTNFLSRPRLIVLRQRLDHAADEPRRRRGRTP